MPKTAHTGNPFLPEPPISKPKKPRELWHHRVTTWRGRKKGSNASKQRMNKPSPALTDECPPPYNPQTPWKKITLFAFIPKTGRTYNATCHPFYPFCVHSEDRKRITYHCLVNTVPQGNYPDSCVGLLRQIARGSKRGRRPQYLRTAPAWCQYTACESEEDQACKQSSSSS